MSGKLELAVTRRQRAFLDASCDEVLFGGAAGGGKSYGQLVDALLFALRCPGSRQLVLRRTYPELERSLILTHLSMFPAELYRYNAGQHRGRFVNGSVIEFGYCDSERDVYKYQSAEYDVIRFDELTHFTEQMYLYLMSRVRGANGFPKQVKSSTNPGGVGHFWVKARFIDPAPPDTVFGTQGKQRLFLPARVRDNRFLTEGDPDYVRRLENLPELDRRALLDGDWDLFEGQYFTEFRRDVHVVRPFPIPAGWRRYFAMDYGLDMLAGYWIALDAFGRAVVYREIYEPGLIISEAAKRIRALTTERVTAFLAPPDLWNRRQDSGRSAADIFAEHGVPLVRAGNDRVQGWYDLKEWLAVRPDERGGESPGLVIFESCGNLIRCLPAVQYSRLDANDVATEPHELTHAPDALRYFAAGRPRPAAVRKGQGDRPLFDTQVGELLEFGC